MQSLEPTAFEIAAAATGLGVFAVGAGVIVYALGSFLLMGPHTSARRLGVSLRELFREVAFASVTQPLLPLFYFVGRRMDGFAFRGGAGGSVPVVFVHGYMQNRVGFLGLARALTRAGHGPLFGFNYPWFSSLANNAARLDRFVASVCEETGSAAVDLVCHSMGGLVAMEMMRAEAQRGRLKVRRCVTIATPHAGIAWRGPLLGFGATDLRRGSKLLEAHAGYKVAVPCLSIYSSHDNIVHPKETSQLVLRGGRDVEVDAVAHLAILFSPMVARHVTDFLAEPATGAADPV
ncbi:MAG: alpha/beta fold hydrolase [Labilithrix sp.]|nr:alpha/beta fold hydrolase [Labilithrix sp.]